jgi:pyrroline-5-carboxylate reductase
MHHRHALLAVIGGGNMGKAIVLGAIDAKLLSHGEMVVGEPDLKKREEFARWGVRCVASVGEAIDHLLPVPGTLGALGESTHLAACGGQVLLAVKPQSLPEVATALRPLLAQSPRVVISILAGTPTEKVAHFLGANPIVRVMPNTPARLRKGMSAMCLGTGEALAGKTHATLAHDLFASLGEVVKIDESLMDAFTSLAGSGPAYVFYLAEAMVRAAQEVGFDRITADRIVRQTVVGASALLAESHEPPDALRAAVTSKGGTTEAAIAELERAGVTDAVVRAIVAGRDRGRSLAGGS